MPRQLLERLQRRARRKRGRGGRHLGCRCERDVPWTVKSRSQRHALTCTAQTNFQEHRTSHRGIDRILFSSWPGHSPAEQSNAGVGRHMPAFPLPLLLLLHRPSLSPRPPPLYALAARRRAATPSPVIAAAPFLQCWRRHRCGAVTRTQVSGAIVAARRRFHVSLVSYVCAISQHVESLSSLTHSTSLVS